MRIELALGCLLGFACFACNPDQNPPAASPTPTPAAPSAPPPRSASPASSAPSPVASVGGDEPASQVDCNAAGDCELDGRCTFDDGKCVLASEADCAAACKRYGRCTLADAERTRKDAPAFELMDDAPHCIATTDAMCRSSEGCRADGMCRLYAVGGRCEAATNADCAKSQACKREGLCTSGYAFGFPDLRCVAKTEKLCLASDACKESGSCHRVSSHPPVMMALCGPTSDADCKASRLCKAEGFCKFESDSQRCVVSSENE